MNNRRENVMPVREGMAPVQEKRFEYKGFPCVILFQPFAHRCGYVGLPEGHPYYGKNYEDILVDCHGELAYSEGSLYHQNDKKVWWIGFDCAHTGDGRDVATAERLYAGNQEVAALLNVMKKKPEFCDRYPVRSLEYCEEQCRRIVDQIVGGLKEHG